MLLGKIILQIFKNKSINHKLLYPFFFTLLFVFCSLLVNAHVPPVPGATDCGTIQGGVFYSEYYDPPQGTPVSSGACSWVKQGNSSCGNYRYNGVNYTLYTYKFICNTPVDSQYYVLGIGSFLFVVLRKRKQLIN